MTMRYSTGAIILHWTIALFIIVNIVIGLGHESLPSDQKGAFMALHKSLGMTVLLLSFLRYFWRLRHPRPAYPAGMAQWELSLAKAVHFIFYFLILALPVSGWLMSSGRGGVDYFGLFTIPALPSSKAMQGIGHEAHEILGFATIGLLLLHVAGALKHQFIDKMPFLARMGLGTPR